MARPTYSEPLFPKSNSPVPGSEDNVCGASNWHMDVQVRVPYRGISDFVNVLPAIASIDALATKSNPGFTGSVPDLEKSLPLLMAEDFQSDLQLAINGAEEILVSYRDAGYMNDGNQTKIKALIERAQRYLNRAKKLQKYWDNEYISSFTNGVKGWPLVDELFGRGCDYKVSPDKGEVYAMTKDGAKMVSFVCPAKVWKDHHEHDRSLFYSLMSASLRNCRCAQEAAASVGTYYRNKEVYDNQPGHGGLSLSDDFGKGKKKIIKKTLVVPDPPPDIPEIGAEPSDDGGEQTSTPTKKKKKDNTLLIAGVAILGLFAMKK